MECCSHRTSYWLTLFMCSQLFYDVTGRSNQPIYNLLMWFTNDGLEELLWQVGAAVLSQWVLM